MEGEEMTRGINVHGSVCRVGKEAIGCKVVSRQGYKVCGGNKKHILLVWNWWDFVNISAWRVRHAVFGRNVKVMEHEETGCQAPEGPILCINNCGFFGSAATMYMCSKCHREMVLKQEQAKLAASSIESIVNGKPSNKGKELVITGPVDIKDGSAESKEASSDVPSSATSMATLEVKKQGPSRCTTCRKRVGLTGFDCKCGNLFCAAHRYSDKHECPYDYHAAGQDAIAKANPVIKADKLDKI
uniref:SAP2 n=1 Tax=Tamarix hispida TaxID=189793 RepID=A0A8F8T1X3_9CARY|nr:SAP2 [Tamarix hispida]